MQYIEMLFLLIAWHFIADYPLQGDFLAKAKNRYTPLPGVPWQQALLAHGFIHAAGVYVITGSLTFAWIELVLHMSIDDLKCQGKFTFNQDQAFHILCKIAYVLMAGVSANA